MGVANKRCQRKANADQPKLIESYCSECGLLIGASPSEKTLGIMERIHVCPVYFPIIRHQRRSPGKSTHERTSNIHVG